MNKINFLFNLTATTIFLKFMERILLKKKQRTTYRYSFNLSDTSQAYRRYL